MDILRYLSESFWKWAGNLPVEFTGLFCRMALILVLLICLGAGVKNIYQKGFRHVLPLQAASVMVAIIIGLVARLSFIPAMTCNHRSTLFLAAFCCCVILPVVAVRFIIRQKGIQTIAWKIIYGIIFVLIVTQIIVCAVR
ncbi:MAG: hypothetical protein PHH77_04355 [Victivallaceae bacterium]|nr:hypothetical protein [Victivallaceae bacterium]